LLKDGTVWAVNILLSHLASNFSLTSASQASCGKLNFEGSKGPTFFDVTRKEPPRDAGAFRTSKIRNCLDNR